MCHVRGIDTLDSTPDRTPHRAVIEHSWRRSALSGVQPDDAPPNRTVDIASADPLLDAARPVLDFAAARLADTDTSLLLVDHECRMVSRVAFGSTLERTLDELGASPGVPFGEEHVGTTALGTPAEIRGAVAINGREHYLERFKHLSCFGLPIIHPATRRLVGSLCMTEVGANVNPLSVPFVKSIVSDIADRLLDRSRDHQRRVLDAFQHVAPRRDIAVAAVGDDLQLTNALAAELLSATDVGALRALAADPALTRTAVRLPLASGTEVEVLAEPVPGTRGAALFRFRPAVHTEHAAGAPGTSAPRTAMSTVIVGEPGTGRTTEARARAARPSGRSEHDLRHPDSPNPDSPSTDSPSTDPLYVDIAEELIAGHSPDIVGLLDASRTGRRVLVVDGVDLLDDRSATLLAKAAGHATADHPLILVSGPPAGASVAVTALVSRCATRIDLPPLRHRTAELPGLATAMLERIDADLELTVPTTDALLSQEWPGNLTELGSVLRHAAAECARRGIRRVDLAALPERYRTSSRAAHLAGREQAERQAIIDALERHGRNKVHAARDLGISRTTLYARIRALGI